MVDDFRPMWFLIGAISLILGIKVRYLLAIIFGGLLVLIFGIWLGIDYYKTFKENKKK
jgi:hypothetical protein